MPDYTAFALDQQTAAVATPKLPQVAILRASLNGFVIIAGRTALEELRRAVDAALAQEVKE